MGDVPSGKNNSSRGTGEKNPPPVPNASSTSGNVTQPARPAHGNHQPSSTGYPGPRLYGPSSPLDMGNMAYSLPAHQTQPSPYDQQHIVHQYPSPAHAQGLVYPMPSMSPYPVQNPGGGMPYGVPFAPTYSSYGAGQPVGGHYPPFVPGSSMQSMGPGQAPVYGASYYPTPYTASYGHGVHPSTGQPRPPGPQSRPPSRAPPIAFGPPKSDNDKQSAEAEYDVSKTIVDGSNPMKLAQPALVFPESSLPTKSTSTSSTPRGPPRKPKQSGHALWVGNLPPGANVMDLKDHFSQDATGDIESVFLISKSNCAFVNYRSAAACAAALARFHDSRFQGVRLVCRLRKGFTAPGSGIGSVTSRSQSRDEAADALGDDKPAVPEPTAAPRDEGSQTLDRYFVVKSLTVEDLELSKQSGIWATQAHNETNLNQAFETTEHVYLIFSANKSGEYFGYARMLSPINDDKELALEMPPRPEPSTGGPDELDVTMTMATSTAPKGRIIDDSARGTIFWEVESSEEEDVRSEKNVEEEEAEAQSFGKPFRIQWLSTERVHFHRTRGLRNPWNANREVKIARDGTEIEPTAGRKLVQLFHLT